MRPDSLLRLWRYINHLLTYLLTYLVVVLSHSPITSNSCSWSSWETYSADFTRHCTLQWTRNNLYFSYDKKKKCGRSYLTSYNMIYMHAFSQMQNQFIRGSLIRALSMLNQITQESRAVARKPRDAAAVLFGLKFADDIHSSLRVAKLRKPGFRAPNIPAQNRI